MSIHPTITVPQTSQRKWLVVAIAAVVLAGAIAAVLALSLGGSSQRTPSVAPSGSSAAQDASKVPSIFSLTPMGLASSALGTGYALPAAQHGPSVASVLASMDPRTKRYTQAIMALTFKQLAAGAAGQP